MSNRFGQLFSITTWGESHGPAIGVVIDGCPAGLEISESLIQKDLDERRPGSGSQVSKRQEVDRCQILSGVFEGKTTGAPISIVIWNKDANSKPYEAIKELLRPGHANYTYLQKYGIFDHRGGGRASARETATRVAAGAVAKTLLKCWDIEISGSVETGDVEKAIREGDSCGGVVNIQVNSMPAGLGEPVFDRLEADLAKALMSIPASKGFEIGHGFDAAKMSGSDHNDCFDENGLTSNNAGGTLGGISTGEPLELRVAFKPTSSIKKEQKTTTLGKKPATLQLSDDHRHDPCVAIRALPVCKAMVALTLADHILLNLSSKLPQLDIKL